MTGDGTTKITRGRFIPITIPITPCPQGVIVLVELREWEWHINNKNDVIQW